MIRLLAIVATAATGIGVLLAVLAGQAALLGPFAPIAAVAAIAAIVLAGLTAVVDVALLLGRSARWLFRNRSLEKSYPVVAVNRYEFGHLDERLDPEMHKQRWPTAAPIQTPSPTVEGFPSGQNPVTRRLQLNVEAQIVGQEVRLLVRNDGEAETSLGARLSAIEDAAEHAFPLPRHLAWSGYDTKAATIRTNESELLQLARGDAMGNLTTYKERRQEIEAGIFEFHGWGDPFRAHLPVKGVDDLTTKRLKATVRLTSESGASATYQVLLGFANRNDPISKTIEVSAEIVPAPV